MAISESRFATCQFCCSIKGKKKKKKTNFIFQLFYIKKNKPKSKLTLVNPTGPWIHGWSNHSDWPGQVIPHAPWLRGKVSPHDLELGKDVISKGKNLLSLI